MTHVGLDTNILLRALLDDDAAQSPSARQFLSGLTDDRRGYVGIPVMLELFWVLQTRYRLPREELAKTLLELLEVRSLAFEHFEIVAGCIKLYRDLGIDFSDAVIAQRNKDRGCSATVTFDQAAARRIPAMELLA